MSTTTAVTAVSSGAGAADGIALTVVVLTGQAASPIGATASSSTITTPQLAITPSGTGSLVLGALVNGASATAFTWNAATVVLAEDPVTGGPADLASFTSAATTAGTPVTLGATAPAEATTDLFLAMCEILAASSAPSPALVSAVPGVAVPGEFSPGVLVPAAGTSLAVDPSTPAPASANGTTVVFGASFTPPAGALLVAIVSASYAGATSSPSALGVFDSAVLTWTQQASAVYTTGSATQQACGIFTAVAGVSAGGGLNSPYGQRQGGSGSAARVQQLAAAQARLSSPSARSRIIAASGAAGVHSGSPSTGITLTPSCTGASVRNGSASAGVALAPSGAGGSQRAGTAAAGVRLTPSAAGGDGGSVTAGVRLTPSAAAPGGTGGSSPATVSCAYPGTSQVAVAAPGSSNWIYLGTVGQVTALEYGFVCPGGCDSMTSTVMVPASYRTQAFNPGWQVRITRGGHQVWDGKLDEPVPTASGWNLTAVGTGNRGQDFLAVYTDTWPSGEPDESINAAIARGLPWYNPGIGQPAGAWFGQAVDSGAQTITALLNLVCTRGAMTWMVNSQPGGYPGDDLNVFPLPSVVNRLLVCTDPVPRTLGGDINTIWIRYQVSADTSSGTTSVPAVFATTSVQNAASVAAHQVLETYIDLSDAGTMTLGAAQAVGNSILSIYESAAFSGPFTGHYGDLLNAGGVPIDPGTDQAGTFMRLILTDFGFGGQVTPQFPVTFVTGAYSWDDFAQTFTATPYVSVDASLTGLLSLANTILTPIAAASS